MLCVLKMISMNTDFQTGEKFEMKQEKSCMLHILQHYICCHVCERYVYKIQVTKGIGKNASSPFVSGLGYLLEAFEV